MHYLFLLYLLFQGHLTPYIKTAFYGYLAKLGTIVKVRPVVNRHRKGNIWSPILLKKVFCLWGFHWLDSLDEPLQVKTSDGIYETLVIVSQVFTTVQTSVI